MKTYLSPIALLCTISFAFGQAPAIEWQRCLGGSSWEMMNWNTILATDDGGCAIATMTNSNDGDVSGNHGIWDIWLVKLDANGDIEWQKCLGGSGNEQADGLIRSNDGGYVLLGHTGSNDGDVSGNHGTNGSTDVWIVKLDFDGNIDWQKCYGGSSNEYARAIVATDSGFVFTSFTTSNNGDITNYHGGSDAWVVKIDLIGNIVWQRCFGGSQYDEFYSLTTLPDNGIVLSGVTESTDGDVTEISLGLLDSWIVKLDLLGNIQWQKRLGGSGNESEGFITNIDSTGYIFVCGSNSMDGTVSGNYGLQDVLVYRLETDGTVAWSKNFGGSLFDLPSTVIVDRCNNILIAVSSSSNDIDVDDNHGLYDSWLLKLNLDGDVLWKRSYGGSSNDDIYGASISIDERIFFCSRTVSNDGDVSGNHGGVDCWVVKLQLDTLPISANVVISELTTCPCDAQFAVHVCGGIPPYSYLWGDGSTSSTNNDLCSGLASVTVTDGTGIQIIVDSLSVDYSLFPYINAQVTDAHCEAANGSVYIQITNDTSIYEFLWSTGDSTENLDSVTSGTYSVTITNTMGCSYSSEIVVGNISSPPTPTIEEIGDSLYALPVDTNYIYQWFVNGLIDSNVTSPIHERDTMVGTVYNVIILDPSTGCTSDASADYVVVFNSLDKLSELTIVVYPNPTAANININVYASGTLSIYDAVGKPIFNDYIDSNNKIYVSTFPAGLYMYRLVTTAGKTASGKFVVTPE